MPLKKTLRCWWRPPLGVKRKKSLRKRVPAVAAPLPATIHSSALLFIYLELSSNLVSAVRHANSICRFHWPPPTATNVLYFRVCLPRLMRAMGRSRAKLRLRSLCTEPNEYSAAGASAANKAGRQCQLCAISTSRVTPNRTGIESTTNHLQTSPVLESAREPSCEPVLSAKM